MFHSLKKYNDRIFSVNLCEKYLKKAFKFFKIFACDLRQQEVQFQAKYPLFESQSDREFTFSAMRFHAKYPLFNSQSDLEFTFSYVILQQSTPHIHGFIVNPYIGNPNNVNNNYKEKLSWKLKLLQ